MEVVTAVDDVGAGKLARERLERTRHYLAVEIWEDDRRVGEVGRTPEHTPEP